ncbi:MAG: phytanoyl-CoA dioxygenase family protein [Ilumatobacteraceae bacterium]
MSLLSARQLESFDNDGFLVIPNFIDETHCLELRQRALELAEQYVPSPEQATIFTADANAQHAADEYFLTSGDKIRCFFEKDAFGSDGKLRSAAHLCLNKLGHGMHDLDPIFDQFSRTPAMASVAAEIGMKLPLLLQSMYIFKQPRIGGEVNCHTDHTFLWTEPQSAIGFWVAIDDATTENGCMWALPGGHRIPVKSRSKMNATRTATITEVYDSTPYPTTGLVPLEATRGTLILLNGSLPHRSGPNTSHKPRHAYTVHVIDGTANYLSDNWLQRPQLPLRGFAA